MNAEQDPLKVLEGTVLPEGVAIPEQLRAKGYRRLADHAYRRSRPERHKRVYLGQDPLHVLIALSPPKGPKVFRYTLEGVAALAEHQPLCVLEVCPDASWIKLSHAGDSLSQQLAAQSLDLEATTRQVIAFLVALPGQTGLVTDTHPFLDILQRGLESVSDPDPMLVLADRLARRMRSRGPVQGRAVPGVLDFKLGNLCRDEQGRLSLIDFDSYRALMPQDLMLGFFLADLDCETDFRTQAMRLSQKLGGSECLRIEGMFARLSKEFYLPLRFDWANPRHVMQMQQRLAWLEARYEAALAGRPGHTGRS